MKDEVANNDGNIQHSYDYFVVASSNITVRLKNKLDYKSDMDIISKCDLSGSSSESNKPKLYNFVDGKGILGKDFSNYINAIIPIYRKTSIKARPPIKPEFLIITSFCISLLRKNAKKNPISLA